MKLLEEVITEENVQSLGEQIAVIAVGAKARRVLGHLDHIYKGLLYDVHKRNTPNHIFSDGYDLAQMAICFLWEHKGKRLSDYYGKDGKGKDCNILYACYHVIDRYLWQYCKKVRQYVSLEDNRDTVEEIEYRSNEQDYTKYDAIVEKMNLNQGEQATLDCYMAGMTYCNIAKFLEVDTSTVWRRRQSLMRKYMQAIY